MTYQMRDVRVPDDFDGMSLIFNQTWSEPATVDKLLKWEKEKPVGNVQERRVMIGADGTIVAYGETGRFPWMKEGEYWMYAATDRAHQNRGVGTALWSYLEAWAQGRGATELVAEVRDNAPESLSFVQKRGYEIDRHRFESTLDLATFDESRFMGVVEAVEAGGIRFFTLADERNAQIEQQLYNLRMKSAEDIPGYDRPSHPPFEQWRKWTFEDPDKPLDCIIVAAEGDTLAGMTEMAIMRASGAMYTQYTGVHRSFRGRNIALALKLLAVRTARRYGAPYMRTNNDSKNAPMLAVNRKLGYQAQPGLYVLKRKV